MFRVSRQLFRTQPALDSRFTVGIAGPVQQPPLGSSRMAYPCEVSCLPQSAQVGLHCKRFMLEACRQADTNKLRQQAV